MCPRDRVGRYCCCCRLSSERVRPCTLHTRKTIKAKKTVPPLCSDATVICIILLSFGRCGGFFCFVREIFDDIIIIPNTSIVRKRNRGGGGSVQRYNIIIIIIAMRVFYFFLFFVIHFHLYENRERNTNTNRRGSSSPRRSSRYGGGRDAFADRTIIIIYYCIFVYIFISHSARNIRVYIYYFFHDLCFSGLSGGIPLHTRII